MIGTQENTPAARKRLKGATSMSFGSFPFSFFFWSKSVIDSDQLSFEAPSSLLIELGLEEVFSWGELLNEHCVADEFNLDSYEYQQQLFEKSHQ